jgi:hypothetical protein
MEKISFPFQVLINFLFRNSWNPQKDSAAAIKLLTFWGPTIPPEVMDLILDQVVMVRKPRREEGGRRREKEEEGRGRRGEGRKEARRV